MHINKSLVAFLLYLAVAEGGMSPSDMVLNLVH